MTQRPNFTALTDVLDIWNHEDAAEERRALELNTMPMSEALGGDDPIEPDPDWKDWE